MARDIGDKVRKMRRRMGLSQSDLAQKAGIAQSTLSYIESGKKAAQFDTLSAICRGLGISMLQLLSHDETKAGKKLFEQQDAALALREVKVNFSFPESLPADALRELLEFQKYIDYKYGPFERDTGSH